MWQEDGLGLCRCYTLDALKGSRSEEMTSAFTSLFSFGNRYWFSRDEGRTATCWQVCTLNSWRTVLRLVEVTILIWLWWQYWRCELVTVWAGHGVDRCSWWLCTGHSSWTEWMGFVLCCAGSDGIKGVDAAPLYIDAFGHQIFGLPSRVVVAWWAPSEQHDPAPHTRSIAGNHGIRKSRLGGDLSIQDGPGVKYCISTHVYFCLLFFLLISYKQ